MFDGVIRRLFNTVVALILFSTAVQACSAENSSESVEFFDVTVSDKPVQLVGRKWGLKISFAARNSSNCIISYLKVAIISRNELHQIVDLSDAQLFYSGSLPQGLIPNDEIIHSTFVSMRDLADLIAVRSIDVSIIEVVFSNSPSNP